MNKPKLYNFLYGNLIFYLLGAVVFLSHSNASAQLSPRQEACIQAKQSENGALNAQDWEAVIRAVRRTHETCGSLANSPRDLSNRNSTVGLALQMLGRHQESIEWTEEAISQYYNNPWTHYQLATSYRALGRDAQASTIMKRAENIALMIVRDPNYNLDDRASAQSLLDHLIKLKKLRK